MGKKKSEKEKPSGKDSKKEKLSVSAMSARMDDKPKKSTSSRSKEASSYLDGFDLPPSDDEEEYEGVSDEEQRQMGARRKHKSEQRQLDTSATDKQKKREKKERSVLEAAHIAKTKALEMKTKRIQMIINDNLIQRS